VGSTKSYDYVREHIEATAAVDYVPEKEEITVEYEVGNTANVELHDGSVIQLHKLASDWNPLDRHSAVQRLHAAAVKGEVLTGLIYIDPNVQDLHDFLKTTEHPLNTLRENDLFPGNTALDKINAEFR
jgi:2-oxoglutarate ferredoxin oxidoreductase subunit beta